MRTIACFFAFVCVTFLSCHSSKHTDVIIGVDSMKVVVFDMLRMDALLLVMQAKDSTLKKRKENIRLYEEVFALHHITKDQFNKSFKFYEAHPIRFKELIDSLDNYSIREKAKINNANHGQSR